MIKRITFLILIYSALITPCLLTNIFAETAIIESNTEVKLGADVKEKILALDPKADVSKCGKTINGYKYICRVSSDSYTIEGIKVEDNGRSVAVESIGRHHGRPIGEDKYREFNARAVPYNIYVKKTGNYSKVNFPRQGIFEIFGYNLIIIAFFIITTIFSFTHAVIILNYLKIHHNEIYREYNPNNLSIASLFFICFGLYDFSTDILFTRKLAIDNRLRKHMVIQRIISLFQVISLVGLCYSWIRVKYPSYF